MEKEKAEGIAGILLFFIFYITRLFLIHYCLSGWIVYLEKGSSFPWALCFLLALVPYSGTISVLGIAALIIFPYFA